MTDDMRRPTADLVLRGLRIATDAHGNVCLNDLWRLAGQPENKRPRDWRRYAATKGLIAALVARIVGDTHNSEDTVEAGLYFSTTLTRAAAVALAMNVALAPISPVAAQMVREHDAASVRGFHTPDGRPAIRIRRSFQSDGEARAVLREVLAAAGLQGLEDRIILRATADTAAAEAFIEKDERLIAYNAVFMQSLRQKTNEYWSLVAVLAHEVGHHVRFHTVIAGRNHEFELEADYQAGFILRRMGATLDQAQAAFQQFPETATTSHPGRADRVQAVTLGWVDGGAPPRGMPGVGGAGVAPAGDPAADAAAGYEIQIGSGPHT
jgi:hypothetical protein